MNKLDQRIKELQTLINLPEFNEIIEEKLTENWRESRNEVYREHNQKREEYCKRLKASLTKEEKERMEKSHRWRFVNDEEEECMFCKIDLDDMWRCPQYCLTEEEKKDFYYNNN